MENLDIGALLKKGYGVKGLEFTERNFKCKPAFKTYFLLTVHQDDLFSLQFELWIRRNMDNCFTFRSCQMLQAG